MRSLITSICFFLLTTTVYAGKQPPQILYDGFFRPPSELCTVKHDSSTIKWIDFDGHQTTGDSVYVLPGTHTIQLRYWSSHYAGTTYFSDPVILKFTCFAGHTYESKGSIHSSIGHRTWRPYVADVRDKKIIVEVESKMIPLAIVTKVAPSRSTWFAPQAAFTCKTSPDSQPSMELFCDEKYKYELKYTKHGYYYYYLDITEDTRK